MKSLRHLILPILVLAATAAMAGGLPQPKDFEISISTAEQTRENWPDQPGFHPKAKAGLPLIYYCPEAKEKTGGPPNIYTVLYVLLKGTRTTPMKLEMAASDWYDCISFQITDHSGRTYSVHKKLIPWEANPSQPWYFAPGGTRVMTADLCDGTWEGLPPAWDDPQFIRITACFDIWGNKDKVTSASTEACLAHERPQQSSDSDDDASSPSPTPDIPYATKTAKEGFVLSPYAPKEEAIDVRGFPRGTEVKDPYSGKVFLVP